MTEHEADILIERVYEKAREREVVERPEGRDLALPIPPNIRMILRMAVALVEEMSATSGAPPWNELR
jgi:hypothetical protein